MHIYIDTEFTDFINIDLISFGAVAEDGQEFYVELSDYDTSMSSDFVKREVVPLLVGPPYLMSRLTASCRLDEWLRSFKEPLTVVIDYIGDYQLMIELLGEKPGYILGTTFAQTILMEAVSELQLVGHERFSEAYNTAYDAHKNGYENWFTATKLKRHVALYDARALKAGVDAGMATILSRPRATAR